ncbi:MAG: hypothetical protein ACYDBB_23250 [Armatimonadota bacterium]
MRLPTMLEEHQNHQPVTRGPAAFRRLCAVMLVCAGIALGASAWVTLLGGATQQQLIAGLVFLVAGLVTLVISRGLLLDQALWWTIFHFTGFLATIGLSVLVVLANLNYFRALSEGPSGFDIMVVLASLLIIGLLLWGYQLLKHDPSARFLWELATVTLATVAVCVWITKAIWAIIEQQLVGYAGAGVSLIWVIVASVVMRKLREHPKPVATPSKSKKTTHFRKIRAPGFFSSPFHEQFARGHFCEIFGLTCSSDTPCPLATKVAAKYQMLRMQYEHSTPILSVLEKTYVILVTPRMRELCTLAHEIMQAKAKAMGQKRFEEHELELWLTLWNRLQESEFGGEPKRVRDEKDRLIDEFINEV